MSVIDTEHQGNFELLAFSQIVIRIRIHHIGTVRIDSNALNGWPDQRIGVSVLNIRIRNKIYFIRVVLVFRVNRITVQVNNRRVICAGDIDGNISCGCSVHGLDRDAVADLFARAQFVVCTVAGVSPRTVGVHVEIAVGTGDILRHHRRLTHVCICDEQLAAGVQSGRIIGFTHLSDAGADGCQIIGAGDVHGDSATGCSVHAGHCDAVADLLAFCQFIVCAVTGVSPTAVSIHMECAVRTRDILRHKHSLPRINIGYYQMT